MWRHAYAPHFRICKVSVKSWKSLVGQWFIFANRKFCKNYLFSVTSLWCTFVNPFLVVHPTHILVHPRVHRAHRLKSAALDESARTNGKGVWFKWPQATIIWSTLHNRRFGRTAIKCTKPEWKIKKFYCTTLHFYFWGRVVSSFKCKQNLNWSLLSTSLFTVAERKQAFVYADNCLKHGFTSVEVTGEIRSQCPVCFEVLAHVSLKEVKLRGYLE